MPDYNEHVAAVDAAARADLQARVDLAQSLSRAQKAQSDLNSTATSLGGYETDLNAQAADAGNPDQAAFIDLKARKDAVKRNFLATRTTANDTVAAIEAVNNG